MELAIRQLVEAKPSTVGAAILALVLWCASLGMIASGVADLRSGASQRPSPRQGSVLNPVTLPVAYASSSDECAGHAHSLTAAAFNTLAEQLGEAQAPRLALWVTASVVSQDGLLTTLASSAAQRAQELGADLVVYGVLECASQSLNVSYFLYVAPSALRTEGNLAGAYRLHTWVQPKGASPSAETDRAMEAAALIARGLRHYMLGSYDDALSAASAFEAALRSSVVADLQLRALLSHMVGNAYVQASVRSCAETTRRALLQTAEGFYLRAIDNAPRLANAHLMLGRLYAELAPVDAEASEVDRWLARGETHFLHALNARPQPDLWGIEMRVMVGRAHARLIEHHARGFSGEQSPSLAAGDLLLQSALGQYRALPETNREALREEAARSYLLLSQISKARGWRQGAIDALWLAESLAAETETRATAASALAEALTADGDLCVAAAKALIATQMRCEPARVSLAERAQTLHLQCRLRQDQAR
ncbi:MAG: hypothetical protein RMM31_08145 [Anaerolineae bacterium]|nr:hypothetical protein [Thermoflexales bacterium]MDW8396198.1 hypothetical protein [Anaerolineae bacterium]